MTGRGFVPFEEVRAAALASAHILVPEWAPGGKIVGRSEYQPLNPRRCDKKTGAFSINLGSGRWLDHGDDMRGGDLISLFAYLHEVDYHEAALLLADRLGIVCEKPSERARDREASAKRAQAERRAVAPPASPPKDGKNAQWAREIWAQAQPAAGTVVERYLRATRGIDAPPPSSLRFAWLTHKTTGQVRHPAMVAPMIGLDGRLSGVHRTWLAQDGRKASLKPPRAMLGDAGPAPLFRANAALGICEGVETALSLRAVLPELPVWAALSIGAFARLRLPAGVERVVLVPDGDRALDPARFEWRRPAAAVAKEAGRVFERAGARVFVYVPPPGRDLNDLLREDPPRLAEVARHVRAFLAEAPRKADAPSGAVAS